MYKIYSNGFDVDMDIINNAIYHSNNEDIIFLAVKGKRKNRNIVFGSNISIYSVEKNQFLKFFHQDKKQIIPPLVGLVKEEYYEEKFAMEILLENSNINNISYVNNVVAETSKIADVELFSPLVTEETMKKITWYNKSLSYICLHNLYASGKKKKYKIKGLVCKK